MWHVYVFVTCNLDENMVVGQVSRDLWWHEEEFESGGVRGNLVVV